MLTFDAPFAFFTANGFIAFNSSISSSYVLGLLMLLLDDLLGTGCSVFLELAGFSGDTLFLFPWPLFVLEAPGDFFVSCFFVAEAMRARKALGFPAPSPPAGFPLSAAPLSGVVIGVARSLIATFPEESKAFGGNFPDRRFAMEMIAVRFSVFTPCVDEEGVLGSTLKGAPVAFGAIDINGGGLEVLV